MFVKAIQEVAKFTRPIHIISRTYKDTHITPGAATLFFVNENGFSITCKHVIDLITKNEALNKRYHEFVTEKNALKQEHYDRKLKALEKKHKLNPKEIIQLKGILVSCTKEPKYEYDYINHPKYDLSIIRFKDFKNPAYTSYAKFVKDSSQLQQGKYLCRLGFPFPEFTNFKYNEVNDDIEWTNKGRKNTPRFPIDGMLTRHLQDGRKNFGIEISTPGLKGQSGGPLFNAEGHICGMQSMTSHLHLGFDMKNYKYNAYGKNIAINNQPFLHVGRCVHVDVIKEFLTLNKVKFYESN